MTELCQLEHDRPTRLIAPLTVCTWHRDRAERAVAELPGLHDFLSTRLVSSGATGQLTGLPHGGDDDATGIDINHRVLTCRTDIRNNLSTWARVVCEERVIEPPRDTIAAIATFIVAHIEWITSQEYARQFVNDVIDDWQTARGLSDPNRQRRVDLKHRCPEFGCMGTLVADLRPKDSLLPPVVVCSESPSDEETGELTHVWPADRWMTLGRAVMRVVA